MSDITEAEFFGGICENLAAHPEWLKTALHATTEGMGRAMAKANALAAAKDMAMLAALSLCDEKRVTPELRSILLETIKRGIDPAIASQIEKKFLGLESDCREEGKG